MNAAQAAFVGALRDEGLKATTSLREEVEKLADAATALQNYDVDAAWAKIEKAAKEIVEKSDTPLTEAQAVARVMREQPALYSDYQQAHDARLGSIEKSRNRIAQRGLAESAEENLAGIVRKGIDLGLSEDEAVDMAIQRRPDLVEAAGVDVPAVVEKAGGALAKIEQAAQRELARDRTLSHAQAMSRALGRSPALYTAYLAEVNNGNAPDDEAAAGPWPPTTGSTASKSPLDGLKPRQPVGKAAAEPQDGPRSAPRANTTQAEAQLVRIVQKTVQAGMAWDDAVDFAITARPDLVAAAGTTGEAENRRTKEIVR